MTGLCRFVLNPICCCCPIQIFLRFNAQVFWCNQGPNRFSMNCVNSKKWNASLFWTKIKNVFLIVFKCFRFLAHVKKLLCERNIVWHYTEEKSKNQKAKGDIFVKKEKKSIFVSAVHINFVSSMRALCIKFLWRNISIRESLWKF